MTMSTEPMFNLREKAPVVVFFILILLHILRHILPDDLLEQVLPWMLLYPLGLGGTSLDQNLVSLLCHGFVHIDITHILMNGFMIVAFGVVTLQGLRADISFRPALLTPIQKFYLIFILGVIIGGVFQWGWWAITGKTGTVIGASGGASALFATMAYAIGGRDKLIKFGLGWAVINLLFAVVGPSVGVNLAWVVHIGGYVVGMIFARLWVRPTSTSFQLN